MKIHNDVTVTIQMNGGKMAFELTGALIFDAGAMTEEEFAAMLKDAMAARSAIPCEIELRGLTFHATRP